MLNVSVRFISRVIIESNIFNKQMSGVATSENMIFYDHE